MSLVAQIFIEIHTRLHIYIYIFAKYEEESFEEVRNQLGRAIHSWSRNYFRLDKIARLGLPENLFTEEKKKKRLANNR